MTRERLAGYHLQLARLKRHAPSPAIRATLTTACEQVRALLDAIDQQHKESPTR
jgi:hypothetical protein